MTLALAALCCMLFASPAAAQWVAAELFPDPPAPTEAGPHGGQGLAGVIDTSPVIRGLGRLRMQLPGGGTVELARDGFERRKDGDVTWRGQVEGDKDSRAILTVKNGYMAGRIYRGLDEFEIRPGAGYSHVIERVDTSIVPIDEHVEPDIEYSETWNPDIYQDPYAPYYGNSPGNIQLMVAYTSRARAAAGGTPQMEVRIQSMVDLANTAFIDSGMIARYGLVHAAEVAYPESGDVVLDLEWAHSNPDIGSLRYLYRADMVSLIVENQGRCAGVAFVMTMPDHGFGDYAYNVSALSCGATAFAHEHGHNMGFEHNPEDSIRAEGYYNYLGEFITSSYPWSFGHYVDGSFRTIMSYPTRCLLDCPTALRFSNPDITFLGSPTGIVDERDNARTGDQTALIVADFMDAVTGNLVNRRVAASVEDVEELADGSVVLDSATLELGDGLSGVQAVGLRFQDLNIPPGMRIDSAYLEFEAADIGSVATRVQIRAEAADSAAAFTGTAFDVTGRPATLASVAWDLPAWSTVTEKHYSPDISAVIQEVVDRPGWLENNSMVLTVGGTGIRTALAHDGGAASAPLLHVEYSSPDRPATISSPVARFSYICTGLTCAFTDESTDSDGMVVYWSWHFGYPLSVPSVEQNPTVTFPAAGSYSIWLEVYDDQGEMGWTEQWLTITETGANITPVATDNFYYVKTNATLSGNVLTDGIPDSDFDGDPLTVTAYGDPIGGTLSVAPNGDFTFTSNGFEGNYSFGYTISDGKGGTAQARVNIEVEPLLTADFRYSCVDLTCSFADASISPDGEIVSWLWYFYGPISTDTSVDRNPSYDFSSPGTYRVSLDVTDSNGNSGSVSKEITVNISNDPPVAAFSYNCIDLNCVFTDASADAEGPIASWNWSFGDGATSTLQNPEHLYAAVGFYSVTLTVADTDGTTGTITQTVKLNAPPVATANAYTTSEDVALSGNVLTDGTPDSDADGDALTVTTNTNPLNGVVTVAANGVFTYTPDADFNGTDSFTYTVSDGTATASATVAITVNPVNDPPVAAFGYGCAEATCSFTDNSTDIEGDIVSWAWTFGDGAVSAVQNPIHSYSAGGTYTVALTVTDGDGATGTVSEAVVAPAGNPPVATADAYATNEDVAVSGNVLTDGTPDSDPDGDPLTVMANTDPLSGTVSMAANGAFTYTPNTDFNGTDGFTYTIGDGNGNSTTATVVVTVNPVNDAPVATNDNYTTDEDVAISGNVLTDGVADSDADGDAITVTGHTNPAYGTVTVAANGAFTFTPYPDMDEYSGTFSYTVSDGNGGSDTAVVSIWVRPVNDPPVAAFRYSCTEEIYCDFFNASTDVDGNIPTDEYGVIASGVWNFSGGNYYNVFKSPPIASATFEFGIYTVTLQVTDDAGATGTVSQTLYVGNKDPIAVDDTYSLAEDGTKSGNVLTDGTNDSDPDGDRLTVTANTDPLNGAVTVAANGAFTYTPHANFNGTDSFTYTISDGKDGVVSATVTMNVFSVNDNPVATDNAYTTDEDVAVSGNVLTDGTPDSDIDGDSVGITGHTPALFGTAQVSNVDGSFSYTPNANFSGTDSFTYTVQDGIGGTDTGTVTITVNPVNDVPVAAFIHSCADLNCAFTDGSTDIEGVIAAWSWSFGDGVTSTLQNPVHGYAAEGTYSVSLTVTDGQGAIDTVTQAITANFNRVPVATDNAYTTAEDTQIIGNVLTDGTPDSDADGDTLTVTANTNPASGILRLVANGDFVYTPNADFNGSDNFTYTVSDGVASATATVTITVTAVSDAPVATADSYTTSEDVAVSGNVLLDGTPDSDADGDALTVTANSNPDSGMVTVAASGAFTYMPNADFTGADNFIYAVSDGTTFATATVTVTVTPVNDAPVANDNVYTTAEDIAVSGNVLLDGTPDGDIDGDALTVTANTSPLNGSVTVAATGAFTYTPNADFNGSDGFDYTVSDSNGGTATAAVAITVTPVNDAPVASFAVTCTDLDCGFADGSTDIDGTIVAWSWNFGDGATSIGEARTQHSYAAVDGTYTVTLTVTDDQGASDTVAQSVTVVNPFPPAAPSGLVGSSITSGKGANAVMAVTLSWTDNAINEEVFVIERCEVQKQGQIVTCGFAPIVELAPDVTGYADSLPGNSSFRYRVKARNRNGDSGYSNETEVPSTQTAAVNQ